MGAETQTECKENFQDLKSFTQPYSPVFYVNSNILSNCKSLHSFIKESMEEKGKEKKIKSKLDDYNGIGSSLEQNIEDRLSFSLISPSKDLFGINILKQNSKSASSSTANSSNNYFSSINENFDFQSPSEEQKDYENYFSIDLLVTKPNSLKEKIREKYIFKDFIGEGGFGTVRTGYRKKEYLNHKIFAIKSINKKGLTKNELVNIMKEAEIISTLDHPYIIKFYETFYDDYYFHIVTELCRGKDLITRFNNAGKKIEENIIKRIIMKILLAINYCHSKGIVHRDIKPENILYETPGNENGSNEIKLIDFGLSTKIKKNEKLHVILGSPYYIAPEVLGGNYNEKCDIWSIGTIGYFLLYGIEPFKGKVNEETFSKIIYEEPSFKSLNSISDLGRDFIKKCLMKNPSLRMSAKEALSHPWLEPIFRELRSQRLIDNNILCTLSKYVKGPIIKQLVLYYFVSNMGHIEINCYKNTFLAFNTSNNGIIVSEELKKGFSYYHRPLTDKQIRNIMFSSEDVSKPYLSYTGFITCCINLKDFLTPEKLYDAFCYFDIDNNLLIDTNDIFNTILRWGKEVLNREDLDKIIFEVTKKQESGINLENFIKVFCEEINVEEYLKEIYNFRKLNQSK